MAAHDQLFWTQVAAVGQVAGAVATFAAVVVSLYIAISGRRPRLRLVVGERLTIGGGAPEQRLLMFSVTNVGQRVVHVRTLGWRTGRWRWEWPKWLARQFAVQVPGNLPIGTEPPYELLPGSEISTFLDMNVFLEKTAERKGWLFAKKGPVLGLRRTAIWGFAATAGGYTVRARVEPSLAKTLFEAEARKSESHDSPASTSG